MAGDPVDPGSTHPSPRRSYRFLLYTYNCCSTHGSRPVVCVFTRIDYSKFRFVAKRIHRISSVDLEKSIEPRVSSRGILFNLFRIHRYVTRAWNSNPNFRLLRISSIISPLRNIRSIRPILGYPPSIRINKEKSLERFETKKGGPSFVLHA